MTYDMPALGWKKRDLAGFTEYVGPIWERADPVRLALVVEAKHLNKNGVVHGGMLSTLLDNALAAKVVAESSTRLVATISLNVEFVAGAKLGDLIEADPEIIRVTRSVVFVRGVLKVGGTVVAMANGVWKILDRK